MNEFLRTIGNKWNRLLCRFLKHQVAPQFLDDLDVLLRCDAIRCIRCKEVLTHGVKREPTMEGPKADKSFVNGCKSKKRYSSRKEALEALGRLRVRPETLHSYPCRHCDGWHLGNAPKNWRKPRHFSDHRHATLPS